MYKYTYKQFRADQLCCIDMPYIAVQFSEILSHLHKYTSVMVVGAKSSLFRRDPKLELRQSNCVYISVENNRQLGQLLHVQTRTTRWQNFIDSPSYKYNICKIDKPPYPQSTSNPSDHQKMNLTDTTFIGRVKSTIPYHSEVKQNVLLTLVHYERSQVYEFYASIINTVSSNYFQLLARNAFYIDG